MQNNSILTPTNKEKEVIFLLKRKKLTNFLKIPERGGQNSTISRTYIRVGNLDDLFKINQINRFIWFKSDFFDLNRFFWFFENTSYFYEIFYLIWWKKQINFTLFNLFSLYFTSTPVCSAFYLKWIIEVINFVVVNWRIC